jgi:Rieske Fe-S protein
MYEGRRMARIVDVADVPPRRRFLEVVACGAASSAWLASGCSGADQPAEPAQFGDVSAGNLSDLPVGALQPIAGQPAVIGRDDRGVYAMTLTCTHQGCTIAPSGTGAAAMLRCPCHGSQFDRDGGVTHGPASSPLVHFAVSIATGGDITVHGGTRVDAATRAS